MKKLLCILISTVFLISSGIYSFAEISAQDVDDISAERFAMEIADMIKANDNFTSLPGKRNSSETINNEFKTARLVVKSRYKINTQNAVSVLNGYDDLWVLQFSSPDEAEKAYNYYLNQNNIDFVEADKELYALSNEAEPLSFSEINNNSSKEKSYLSWGPEHIGIDVLNNNLINEGTYLNDTVVAVVDTGVDPDHPYLHGRVLPTRINTSSSGLRNDSMDDNGHGTQIAGVIADCTINNVFIQPYKVLNNKGKGTLISLAAGINCAVNDDVDVINISIGFEEESDILKAAIDNAEMNDILVVGAAGNDGSDTLYYPASYDNVVKVSAINESNIITNFSTYGNGVDFAAPGIRIKTTSLLGEYSSVRGTSIATPFVTSVAAVIKSMLPDLSVEDILEIMTDSAVLVNEHTPEIKYGNGVIRAPQSPDELDLKDKTSAPYFSHKTSFSQTELDIEIFCDTFNSEIYYTTDRTVPSKSNPTAIKYNGTPIHASQTITVLAVAYCDGKYRSSVSSFATIIAPYADESALEVDPDGTLTAYNGDSLSITIPEKVNGTDVTSIGEYVFANKNVTEIILPNTVTEIKNSAFKDCINLKTVYGKNVTKIGSNAFNGCIWIKNMFLMSELECIGEYSFADTGSKQNLVTGSTFKLLTQKLRVIPEGAFSDSAISEVKLGSVDSIDPKAFQGCNQLVNLYADGVSNIPEASFKACQSLVDVEIHNLTYIPSSLFDSCENLMKVNIPEARTVNSNAFKNCVSLVEVSLPAAITVYSNAFNGCTNLKVLELPAMQNFEPELYDQSKNYPLFPANLESFFAPSMLKTVPDMFKASSEITTIRLNSVKEISPNTFRGCHKIYSLNIENIETINEGSFNDCSISFIDARNLVTTADMPDNSGILLSNNFLESTDNANNLTVYGTPGTFVERYSKLKGYDFVGIPLIYKPVPEYITENSETVYVIAVGFDLSYQWYWNTSPDINSGTPIDGATTMSYTFTSEDIAPYYYCEVTQNDLGKISKITTSIITKDTTSADYTAYNEAVKAAKNINRNIYVSTAELDKALDVDVSNRYSCEQAFVDAQTKAIYDAIAALKIKTVDSVELYASETTLALFEETRIITVINPRDVEYKNIEYISNNEKVIVCFPDGYVWCVGSGTADVTVRITNFDDSTAEGKITFESHLNIFEGFIASLLRTFFIIASRISNLFSK